MTLRADIPEDWPLTGLDRAFARFLQQAQPSDEPRHAWLAALTSFQYGRGHACLDLDLLAREGAAALGWALDLADFESLDAGQLASSMPWIEGASSPLVLDGKRLYLRRNWEAEQHIRMAMGERLAHTAALPPNVPQLLDALFPTPSEATLTDTPAGPDWQKVACALAARQPIALITGGPGTGKTTTVVRLLALLMALERSAERPARQALRVALAAPTGKAAARLGESIANALVHLPEALRPTQLPKPVTLHRLLNIRSQQSRTDTVELAVDLVIVDEASMIDLEMMARLVRAVPPTARLVLLGDKDQLASVEAGAVMAQLCMGADAGGYHASTIDYVKATTGMDLRPWAGSGSALAQQTIMLRHSRRFRDDSGIGPWAKAVNAGDVSAVQQLFREAPAAGAEGVDVVDRLQVAGPRDTGIFALVRQGWQAWRAEMDRHGTAMDDVAALAALQAFAQFQVLCALKDGPWGVDAWNRTIADSLGFPEVGWYAGRPVMVTRNDYDLDLMNGDVGMCLPHAKGLRVAFADGAGGVRWVLPSRLDAVETVFAMTVHKSQGSEFTHVCLVLPEQPVATLTRELLYTGITRAKSRLTLVLAQPTVLWRAVQSCVYRSGGLETIERSGI